MKRLIILFVLLGSFSLDAQKIQPVTLETLEEMLEPGEKLKVFNFWASWCGPCIKELPYFEELSNTKHAEVQLVSLDFMSDKEKAERILDRKTSEIKSLILNETDADKYISAIHEDWTGAIPITIFVKTNGDRLFYERSIQKDELFEIVSTLSRNE